MRRKTLILIIIPILAIAALVGWRFVKNAADSKALAQAKGGGGGGGGRGGPGGAGGPTPVVVITASGRTIRNNLDSLGTAQSPFKVSISPKASGRIDFLQVREGDPVKAGQVLVKIDPSDLQGMVAQQEANLAEARSRLAQAKLTQGSSAVGVQSQIAQQSAGVQSAKANLNQTERNFDAQVATANSAVTDASSKVNAATASLHNAQATLAQQQANLANANTKLARTMNLYNQGFIAAQDVDDAKTAADVQQKSVAVAQSQVDSANASIASANAQLASAKSQAQIVRRKGQSDIQVAKAALAQAQAMLVSAQANKSQNPAYQENLSALQAFVDAAQAELDQAKSKLSDTTITSPIEGVVTERDADPGAIASPGSAILVIQQLDWLYISASLPVESIQYLTTGKTVTVKFDNMPGKTFTGPIAQVNPAANLESRDISFMVKLQNPGHVIKPGMFGHVAIPAQDVAAQVALPREAVNISAGGQATVTTVDDKGLAHVANVKTGASDDKYVEILSGVDPGQTVVLRTYRVLKDGQKVKPESGNDSSASQGKGTAGRRGRKGSAGHGGTP